MERKKPSKFTATLFHKITVLFLRRFFIVIQMRRLIHTAKAFHLVSSSKILDTTSKRVREDFLRSKHEVMHELEEELTNLGLARDAIEAGHKIIAARSTMSTRMHLAISEISRDVIAEARKKLGDGALKERIARNRCCIRFTTHPTEGQNLGAIRQKDAVVKLQSLLRRAERHGGATAEDGVQLRRIAAEEGIEIAEKISLQEFGANCAAARRGIIAKFAKNPIHHVAKMTIADERELLLYHMDRVRAETSAIVARHPQMVDVDDIRLTSWAFDMDGKPHVMPGQGVIFEHQSQQKFFDSLNKKLQDFANIIDSEGGDSPRFRAEICDRIKAIAKSVSNRVLVGDEAKKYEREITAILNRHESDSHFFAEIKNYAKSSGCKVAENGFSTREEIDKTNAALAEIMGICQAQEGFAQNPAEIVARNFSNFSAETKRQLMCMMESASLHTRHEHVISQFDCELESFRNALRFFEIAKELPAYYELIPEFREYYAKKSDEAGFDLYQQFFSTEAIARARKSMVELSPLAEEENTIPRLAEFTAAMLADVEIVDYIKKSGGVVRQTRSNSDGSAVLGAHAVTARYLEADIAVRKMVEEAGLKLAILQGIGANDLERMAPWRLELLQSEFTSQGSDMQHQTHSRLAHMLLKEPDTSQEQLIVLKQKHGETEVARLVEFYRHLHLASEFGARVELDGREVYSGNLTQRGLIPPEVVRRLGKLSSRPDARSGGATQTSSRANGYDVWDAMVFKDDVRRIGAISLQRISGLATFCLAPFFDYPKDFDPRLVSDFAAIPLVRNINISALFALGIADTESFMLVNGIDFDVSRGSIKATAKLYEEFLQIIEKQGVEVAMKFAAKEGFSDAEAMRATHMSWQIESCRKVLRHAAMPMILGSSAAIRDDLGEIFEKAEKDEPVSYGRRVIDACRIMVRDEAVDLATKQTLACMAQQVSNVRHRGNFYDTRAKLVRDANNALREGDSKKFGESCEWLAIIVRSAGNPASPGRKTHELLTYFRDSFDKTSVPMEDLMEKTELVRSSEPVRQ
ncbi:MAG: hypothetical protein A3D15_05350 [Alphaproteobacteria bacterium RIFCSPHIGHO2_02_FULL_40_34]|nr:MAG: hypothetical protein A3D15_05350 [Alphaproteobacteria bacterium RIFCSPHIGHO2_02_FULL_40_34]OFX09887.1 MAG: hypothetical protein A3H30_06050 [Alphaproteobacteria bacterium RIFCSPLOWO2_02_FULL_40_19]OFX10936.1 MAG: hypothetical protein A3G22_02200 [Alphaproteobacteria bacterium RIFCSPLOWO2_12_FULL_40_11]